MLLFFQLLFSGFVLVPLSLRLFHLLLFLDVSLLNAMTLEPLRLACNYAHIPEEGDHQQLVNRLVNFYEQINHVDVPHVPQVVAPIHVPSVAVAQHNQQNINFSEIIAAEVRRYMTNINTISNTGPKRYCR